jgi:cytochrome c
MSKPRNKTGLTLACLLAAATAAPYGTAHAQNVEDLARRSACMGCHAVDKPLVGPSFRKIADRYRGDANAPALLADRVRKGSKGVWGPMPMPPNSGVSEENARALVRWILETPSP